MITIASTVVGGIRISGFGLGVLGKQFNQILKIGTIKNCLGNVLNSLQQIESLIPSDP